MDMEVEIYADLLFLINAGMDGLCLGLTAALLHRRVKGWRILLAAAAGGVYAVAALLSDMGQALSLLSDLGICMVMCGMVFGGRGGGGPKRLLTAAGLYFLLSMALGGFMTALYSLLNRAGLASLLARIFPEEEGIGSWIFLILALPCGVLSLGGGRLWRRSRAARYCTVTVELEGRQTVLRGMVDSGNLLRDPTGGRAVICGDPAVLKAILSPSLYRVLRGEIPQRGELSPDDARRVRVIPAKTATGEGLLYGVLPDRVTVTAEGQDRGTDTDAVLALTPIPTEGVDALVPAELTA